MRNLYISISERLDRVDFAAIWPGFARAPFALYDDRRAVLDGAEMPADDRFLGNTSIQLDGIETAIWRVEDGADPDALAAGIVHEMFHSFQRTRGEARFPDDLELLRLGIDAEELSLRALECAILAEQRPDLARFADARPRRRAANPGLTRQAELAETAEGMAEYAGLRALSMIAPQKHAEARMSHRARLRDAHLLPDTRRVAYFTGALLVDAARATGIDITHDVGLEPRTIGEIICAHLSPAHAGEAPDAAPTARAEAARVSDMCAAFRERAGAKIPRRARITGYDPMNMARSGDLLLCARFVMLDGELLMEPVLLELAAGSKDEITGIYMGGA